MSTARNTYVNARSVAQFDFHQSDESNVSLPSLSCLPSDDLIVSARAWYFMTSVFITSIRLLSNVKVLIQLHYVQTINVRHRDFVAISDTLVDC